MKSKKKQARHFTNLILKQEIGNNQPQTPQLNSTSQPSQNAIWSLKFNRDGKYLAAGGQDSILRIWCLISESLGSETTQTTEQDYPFMREPYRIFEGHKADILDLAWSKNDFLLSSSMDKTVRLWHATRKECLCVFQHADFVTSVAFHPKDDRFFLSGCLDCRLRLWNIPEKKVNFWNELPESNLITAVGFTMDGKTAIAGSYLGYCVFYETDGLKYNTQIHVRSSRGKNSKGEKITGIEAMPGQIPNEEKILITSNDSRIRLYNMKDKSLDCKYKGLSNNNSQIKASFSDDGKFIICGSEDKFVYIWSTNDEMPTSSPSPESGTTSSTKSNVLLSLFNTRKDRNSNYEAFQAHDNIVTCAVFAPRKLNLFLERAKVRQSMLSKTDEPLTPERKSTLNSPFDFEEMKKSRISNASEMTSDLDNMKINQSLVDGRFIVTADYSGIIRIYENKKEPETSTVDPK